MLENNMTTPIEELGRKPRRLVNIETLTSNFEKLLSDLNTELEKYKTMKNVEQVKFYKGLVRQTNVLQNDSLKLAKKAPNPSTRRISGFKKQVPISKEMALFCGVPEDTKMARSECTKIIHQYIQSHHMQDKTDKRIIIPDITLKNLLQYDLDTHGPLVYCSIQKLYQHHFSPH